MEAGCTRARPSGLATGTMTTRTCRAADKSAGFSPPTKSLPLCSREMRAVSAAIPSVSWPCSPPMSSNVREGWDKYAECYFGRSEYEAPEIDGKIFFTSRRRPYLGEYLQVRLDDMMDIDMLGTNVEDIEDGQSDERNDAGNESAE